MHHRTFQEARKGFSLASVIFESLHITIHDILGGAGLGLAELQSRTVRTAHSPAIWRTNEGSQVNK